MYKNILTYDLVRDIMLDIETKKDQCTPMH